MDYNLYMVLLSLGLLLGGARLFGEITKQLGFTAILGEVLTGVILGPTCLGRIASDVSATIFPTSGETASILNFIAEISVILFLFVAGMEVNLSEAWRRKRAALLVGGVGLAVPLGTGMVFAAIFPLWVGADHSESPWGFALFFGTALSISALPVIAKILLDLNLYRTELGMIVMPAAVLQDLVGWFIFAVVMGLLGVTSRFSIGATIGLTLIFAGGTLSVGRYLFDRSLPAIQAHWSWPGSIVGLGIAAAFFAAAFSDWIGIHALFGAFVMGVAIGDSRHMTESARGAFRTFISYFFSPLFFASIGLKVDFVSHFEVLPVLVVMTLATVTKIAGTFVGGRLAGLTQRDSLAIGYAMNARGAMQIILGLAALEVGVVTEATFVAMVIMAIATSLMSAPLIKKILNLSEAAGLRRYLKPPVFRRFSTPTMVNKIVKELADGLSERVGNPRDKTGRIDPSSVLRQLPQPIIGIGYGVAVPHVRIKGLKRPYLAVGVSDSAVELQAPDDIPIRVVLLLMTPLETPELPLQIYTEIARVFSSNTVFDRVITSMNHTEFLAAVKSSNAE